MPNFKPKTSKKIDVDKNSIITVNSKHEEFVKKFKEDEKMIPVLKKQRNNIEKKIKKKNNNLNETDKKNMKNLISKIDKQIEKKKKYKINYYLNNSKYIFDYFESRKNISKNDNKKKILNNFFKKSNEKEIIKKNEDQSVNNTKKYLYNVDESFLDIQDYCENYNICKCGGEYIHVNNEGVLICNKCGIQTSYLIEHEKPSYKEPPKEATFYAYKRLNHFREILSQFQAKETTQIKEEILENIKKQIKKERLKKEELTNEKMKEILKNLGYNKYYEHVSFIKNKLGIKPLTMSVELENKLCNLFMEIQRPYAKYCPDDRMNFLNYYYVLYKLCELLEKDEYLPYCYMLKDPEKRIEQDEIWNKICEDLEWEFIPTP